MASSKQICAIQLCLFIEKIAYYEEGIVEIIRNYLIGIGLREQRGYFSLYNTNGKYSIYLKTNSKIEVSCSYVKTEDIVIKPSNPYNNGRKLIFLKSDKTYHKYYIFNPLNVYYVGVVDKFVRIQNDNYDIKKWNFKNQRIRKKIIN